MISQLIGVATMHDDEYKVVTRAFNHSDEMWMRYCIVLMTLYFDWYVTYLYPTLHLYVIIAYYYTHSQISYLPRDLLCVCITLPQVRLRRCISRLASYGTFICFVIEQSIGNVYYVGELTLSLTTIVEKPRSATLFSLFRDKMKMRLFKQLWKIGCKKSRYMDV